MINPTPQEISRLVGSLSGTAAKILCITLISGRQDFSPDELAFMTGRSKVMVLKALEQLRLHGIMAHEYVGAGGFVYLCCANGRFKIGISNDPERRALSLETSSPYPVKLIHFFPADNPQDAERRLHYRFISRRAHGEWFDLTEADIAHIQGITAFRQGEWYHREEQP